LNWGAVVCCYQSKNDGKELFCANMPNQRLRELLEEEVLVLCVSVQVVAGCFFEANLKKFAGYVY
jgi:hypothetical protein